MSAPLLSQIQNLAHQIADDAHLMASIFFYALIFNLINWILLGSRLNILGIYPRKILGIFGFIFSPILHGDFKHFIFNAFPFAALILLSLSLVSSKVFLANILTMHLLSSIFTWSFARHGFHIGASGLICALYGWILTTTYFEPSALSLMILFIVLIYFGGVLMSLFPTQPGVSWEGHLFGFISGVITYFIFHSSYQISLLNFAEIFQEKTLPLLKILHDSIGFI